MVGRSILIKVSELTNDGSPSALHSHASRWVGTTQSSTLHSAVSLDPQVIHPLSAGSCFLVKRLSKYKIRLENPPAHPVRLGPLLLCNSSLSLRDTDIRLASAATKPSHTRHVKVKFHPRVNPRPSFPPRYLYQFASSRARASSPFMLCRLHIQPRRRHRLKFNCLAKDGLR